MDLLSWLKADRQPSSLYELLDKQCLDPDVESLRSAIESANRTLWPYQNHADTNIARKAIRLLGEVGRAADTLSDPAKLANYDSELLRELEQEFIWANNDDRTIDAQRLGDWLLQVKNVHPSRLKEAFRALCEVRSLPLQSEPKQSTAFETPKSPQGTRIQDISAPVEVTRIIETRQETLVEVKPEISDAPSILDQTADPPRVYSIAASALRILIAGALGTAVTISVGAWLLRPSTPESPPRAVPPLIVPKTPPALPPEGNITVSSLVQDLEGSDPAARARAAELLGEFGSEAKSAGLPLLHVMKEDPKVRRKAMQSYRTIRPDMSEEVLSAMIELLESSEDSLQQFALEAVGEWGPKARRAGPAVARLMVRENHLRRHQARDALEKLQPNPEEILPSLASGMKNTGGTAKLQIVQLLTKYGKGSTDATNALMDALADSNRQVRREAADALEAIGADPKQVAKGAIAALESSDSDAKTDALKLLSSLNADLVPLAPKLVKMLAADRSESEAASDMLKAMGPKAAVVVKELTAQLESKNERAIVHAAAILGNLGVAAAPAADRLAKLIESRDYGVCNAASDALIAMGTSANSVAPDLAKMLGDKDYSVRNLAAKTLKHVPGDPKTVVPVLIDQLTRLDNPYESKPIFEQLVLFGPDAQPATNAMLELMLREDRWNQQREEPAKVLAAIGPKALGPIAKAIQTLNDDDGKTPVDRGRRDDRKQRLRIINENRKSFAEAFARAGVNAAPILILFLRDSDREVKQVASKGLSEIGHTAVALLIQALPEYDSSHRNSVLTQIRKFGDDPAVGVQAVPALRDLLKDEDPGVRSSAVTTLGKFVDNTPSAIPALIAALDDAEGRVRINAANMLAKGGTKAKDAVPALRKLAKDLDPKVQQSAIQALDAIDPSEVSDRM